MTRTATRITALTAVLALCLMTPAAFAVSAQAQKVIDEMQDGKHLENTNYSFVEVGYDDGPNVLHFAVTDGQHFKDTANVFYRVPVADINVVTVISNADKTIQDGELKNIGQDMGAGGTGFVRIKQGCSVKLSAKDPSFGFMVLEEGDIQDGKLVETPSGDDLESTKNVTFGFYECAHARTLQNAVHDLHKQVKKGG